MDACRTVVRLCFEAATAFLYAASIAVVFAGAAIVYSQTIRAGLASAALTFVLVAALWGRIIWRKYRVRLTPMFAH